MNLSKALLITSVACLAPFVTYAGSVTSDPTLSVGGLNFSGFTCSLSKGGILATPNNCNQINVNTITSPGVGIQFSSGFSAALGSFDDATLGYHVSSSAGISSIGLSYDGSLLGLAISSVTEQVFSGSHLVGTATVYCNPATCQYTDDIDLHGSYSNLYVEKDIQLDAALGSAQASIVDQTFPDASAPEPASTALMGIGLLCAAGLLRRRSLLGRFGKI